MRTINYDLIVNILEEISNNNFITAKKISQKYGCNERTVRRYFKILKDEKLIRATKVGNKSKWNVTI